MVVKSLESAAVRTVPTWLTLEKDAVKGTVSRMPTTEEIQPLANVQAIVEFYSR
jgi:small subunit ribosomal protein S4